MYRYRGFCKGNKAMCNQKEKLDLAQRQQQGMTGAIYTEIGLEKKPNQKQTKILCLHG